MSEVAAPTLEPNPPNSNKPRKPRIRHERLASAKTPNRVNRDRFRRNENITASGQFKCPNPECADAEVDSVEGKKICRDCGTVLGDDNLVADVQYGEKRDGAPQLQGANVGEHQTGANVLAPMRRMGGGAESRSLTIAHARKIIKSQMNDLRGPGGDDIVEQALANYNVALAHSFTLGRKLPKVIACCLYVTYRRRGYSTILLIDFAEITNTNVFDLGACYKDYKKSCWQNDYDLMQVEPVIDPTEVLERYARKLDFGQDATAIANDASRIVRRMSRDWMVTGRQPTGICGAALILAARMNNYRRTVREVVLTVKVTDLTINKRLEEFNRTDTSRIPIKEWRELAEQGKELKGQADPPVLYYREQREKRREEKRKRKAQKMSAGNSSGNPEIIDEDEGQSASRTSTGISGQRKRRRVDKDGFKIPDIPVDPRLSRSSQGQISAAESSRTSQATSDSSAPESSPATVNFTSVNGRRSSREMDTAKEASFPKQTNKSSQRSSDRHTTTTTSENGSTVTADDLDQSEKHWRSRTGTDRSGQNLDAETAKKTASSKKSNGRRRMGDGEIEAHLSRSHRLRSHSGHHDRSMSVEETDGSREEGTPTTRRGRPPKQRLIPTEEMLEEENELEKEMNQIIENSSDFLVNMEAAKFDQYKAIATKIAEDEIDKSRQMLLRSKELAEKGDYAAAMELKKQRRGMEAKKQESGANGATPMAASNASSSSKRPHDATESGEQEGEDAAGAAQTHKRPRVDQAAATASNGPTGAASLQPITTENQASLTLSDVTPPATQNKPQQQRPNGPPGDPRAGITTSQDDIWPCRNSPDILEDEFADDPEVRDAVLSEEEIKLKEIIWMTHNADWLREEQYKRWLKEEEELRPEMKRQSSGRKKKSVHRTGDIEDLVRMKGRQPRDAAEATLWMMEIHGGKGRGGAIFVDTDRLRELYTSSSWRKEREREEEERRKSARSSEGQSGYERANEDDDAAAAVAEEPASRDADLDTTASEVERATPRAPRLPGYTIAPAIRASLSTDAPISSKPKPRPKAKPKPRPSRARGQAPLQQQEDQVDGQNQQDDQDEDPAENETGPRPQEARRETPSRGGALLGADLDVLAAEFGDGDAGADEEGDDEYDDGEAGGDEEDGDIWSRMRRYGFEGEGGGGHAEDDY